MRKNTLDLLYQLSIPGMSHYRHRVSSQKGVRSDLFSTSSRGPLPTARTTVVESSLAVDASANLFFYLFEDYTAATSILSTSNDVLAKLVILIPSSVLWVSTADHNICRPKMYFTSRQVSSSVPTCPRLHLL